MLFNSTGKAALTGGKIALTGVSGRDRVHIEPFVTLPRGKSATSVTVNGQKVKFAENGQIVTIEVNFAGAQFSAFQQVGVYDPKFDGTTFKGEFTIPARIFDQLKARKQAWPVEYTADDLRAPWIGPDRLLLFVDIPELDAESRSVDEDQRPAL